MNVASLRFGVWVLFETFAAAQVTSRASVGTNGVQGNGDSGSSVISANGRFVAFESLASTLVAGDTNGKSDVFVRDRLAGTTECVSIDLGGGPSDGESHSPAISAAGRYVAFWSGADDLVAGDTNGQADVFVRDRLNGTTERVSVDSSGAQGNFGSFLPGDISADGRHVSFYSQATNLVAGDTNGVFDVFVHDRTTGTTERVTVDSSEVQADSDSDTSSLSGDGRFVAFTSYATNLGPVQASTGFNVFLRDRQLGTTEILSVNLSGVGGIADSLDPSVSDDGRFVSFWSLASDLVTGDTNSSADTFLRDRQAGTTERVSVSTGGAQGDLGGGLSSLSADGRYVVFGSGSTNLVPGDTNASSDVFLRDRQMGTTSRVSVASDGRESNLTSNVDSVRLVTSDAGLIAFSSRGTNLADGNTNGSLDVYVRDALGGPSFTSLCEPGVAGVSPCPCANPPAGPGSGCDNSASTGGATLSAAGGTLVSSDSLAFQTSGEVPDALSILLQGNAVLPNGVVYGQGVRCLGGALKRLYTKSAVLGVVRAPDFALGDPSVTARSAAKGDTIHAGESRWYLVYYRDATVLGSCPASSIFNATQTGRVDWAP